MLKAWITAQWHLVHHSGIYFWYITVAEDFSASLEACHNHGMTTFLGASEERRHCVETCLQKSLSSFEQVEYT